MIYLQDNPLLREPLKPEHIKNRLLGHWGASPGLAFVYIHLNRLIKKYDLNMSDGITEAANIQDELWGEEEVQKVVSISSTLSCDDLIQQVVQAADAYSSGAEQADDMTLVALRIH